MPARRKIDAANRPQKSKLALLGSLAIFILLLLSGSASAANGCFASPSTCGYPDATNTGPTGALTASGGLNLSTPGQTVENLDITGQVRISANNVTIKNSRITGTQSGDSAFIVQINSGTGVKILDTEIRGPGTGANVAEAAVRGDALLERVDLYNCGECVQYDELPLRDSYIHIDSFRSSPNYAHVEGIYGCSQVITVEHSTILVAIEQTAAVIGDTICNGNKGNQFTVKNSLLAGGGGVLEPQANGNSSGANTVITGNRFARCLGTPYTANGGHWYCQGFPAVNGVAPGDSNGYYPSGGSYYLTSDMLGPITWSENVWDDNGQAVCSDGRAGCGSANPPPTDTPATAVWTAPAGAKVGTPVTLSGTASTGDAPISCQWSFENQAGSTVLDTKTGCSVSYTFGQAGTQYVRLTVTDADGDTNASRKTFSVAADTTPPPDTPATAVWTAPTGAKVGTPVTLSGTASTGDAPISCQWSFENQAGTTVLDTKTGCSVSYTFGQAGTQYVRLTVTDADGDTNASRKTFSVAADTTPPGDNPADAVWSAPTAATVGTPVTLSGTASTGDAPISCQWSFEDQAGGAVYGTESGCNVDFTFEETGMKYVRLTVTDVDGDTDANRKSFAVAADTTPPADTPATAVWTAPTGAKVGTPVTLRGTASTGDAPISCKWSFENQSGSMVLDTKTGCSVSYTFRQAGTQYVRLTVTDADGDANASRKTFSVAAVATPPAGPSGPTDPAPPAVTTPVKAVWRAPSGVVMGRKVTLDGSSSQGKAPLSCVWTFENRSGTSILATRTGCKISYAFQQTGIQYVRLRVTSAEGLIASLRRTIRVTGGVVAERSGGSTKGADLAGRRPRG